MAQEVETTKRLRGTAGPQSDTPRTINVSMNSDGVLIEIRSDRLDQTFATIQLQDYQWVALEAFFTNVRLQQWKG